MENWHWVPGYEGDYQVSNFGKVKSFKYNEPRILKPGITHGYRHVSLSGHSGIRTTKIAHLVTEAFIGRKPKGHHVHHKDGNKANDRLDNLEYIDAAIHLSEASKSVFGSSHGLAKLDEEKVLTMRELYATGDYTQQALATMFGVSRVTALKAIRRETWKHI